MSRSGYTYEMDDSWSLIRWRGAVASAIRGQRGQKLLRDLLAALDALPQKRLIANELTADGEFCALGALGAARGLPVQDIDPYDYERVATTFDVAEALAREVVYENDEGKRRETPEERWTRMRAWVASLIRKNVDG